MINLKISEDFKKKLSRGVESLLLAGSLFGASVNLGGCTNNKNSNDVPTNSTTIEESDDELEKVFLPGEHTVIVQKTVGDVFNSSLFAKDDNAQLEHHDGYSISGIASYATNISMVVYISYTNDKPVIAKSNKNARLTNDQKEKGLIYEEFGTPVELNDNKTIQKTK